MKSLSLLNFCLSSSIFAITALRGSTQTLSGNYQNNSIDFEVCSESDTWTRPTVTEQTRLLLDSKRYSTEPKEIEKLLKNPYWKNNLFVFTSYPGGSGTYEINQLSGLWKPFDSRHPIKCDNYIHKLNARKIASIWTLAYKVVSIKWLNKRYLVQVKKVEQGTQVIHFKRRERMKLIPLTIVNEHGQNMPVVFSNDE